MKNLPLFPVIVLMTGITFLILTTTGCKKDTFEPFDIFEPEEPADNQVNILLQGLENADDIFVNDGRVMETDSGYHIKGTVFSQSESGLIPVTSGDFKIINDAAGNTQSFSGYGSVVFPDISFFSDIIPEYDPAGDMEYHLGSFFKQEYSDDDLPLLDKRYYFGFNLDESEYGTDPEINIKKSSFVFKQLFFDASDPAFFIKGDYEFSNKKTEKTVLIDNIGIGFSVNGKFPFIPDQYSDRMEEVTGGTAFEKFSGQLILSGEIPLRRFPITIAGEMVLNIAESSRGETDFFENGFDDAEFELGANGKVYFDNSLISALPVDFKVELAHATVQAKFTDNEKSLRFAGEYSDVNMLEKILGTGDALKYISKMSTEGRIYVSVGSNPDDWKFYLETKLSLDIPGLGVTDLQEGMILITPQGVRVFAKIALPYNINTVSFEGYLYTDGNFLLKGETTTQVDIKDDLQFYCDLAMEISNNGVSLGGAASLPYQIGNVDISGSITKDCISFDGMINSQIDFGQGFLLPAVDLELKVSSCEGAFLYGKLDVPYGIALVEVEGKITAQELALSGLFSSHIDFANGVSMPALDMSFKASTITGVALKGVLDVPYNIAHVAVEGAIDKNGLLLSGVFNSNIDLGNGFKLPAANMSIKASTDPDVGILFSGDLTMPGSIGNIGANGSLNSSGISFYGYMNRNIGIDGFSFSNSFKIGVSSTDGGYIQGDFNVPGNLGNVYVNGWYQPDGSFSLTGSTGRTIDFEIVELGVNFSLTVSSSQVKISASGHGCVGVGEAEICVDPIVSVNPDWANNTMTLCIDTEVLGQACVEF